jgi:hypothetical protein
MWSRTGKTHTKDKAGETIVMQLGNGQYTLTLPKHVAVLKHIGKGMHEVLDKN